MQNTLAEKGLTYDSIVITPFSAAAGAGGSGLSAGAIAGIVVGAVAAIAIATVVIVVVVKKQRQHPQRETGNTSKLVALKTLRSSGLARQDTVHFDARRVTPRGGDATPSLPDEGQVE